MDSGRRCGCFDLCIEPVTDFDLILGNADDVSGVGKRPASDVMFDFLRAMGVAVGSVNG